MKVKGHLFLTYKRNNLARPESICEYCKLIKYMPFDIHFRYEEISSRMFFSEKLLPTCNDIKLKSLL